MPASKMAATSVHFRNCSRNVNGLFITDQNKAKTEIIWIALQAETYLPEVTSFYKEWHFMGTQANKQGKGE